MSRVIAIVNQKGGVGKTTTAINLGASFAVAERRTLVIDMDPQGNATSGLGVSRAAIDKSMYEVLVDREPLSSAIVPHLHFKNLDLVPSDVALVGAEVELVQQPDREVRLRRALESIDLGSVRSNGYSFQIEMTYRALRAGLVVVEVPITFVDRRAGQSKMDAKIFAEAVLSVWRLRWDAFRGEL